MLKQHNTTNPYYPSKIRINLQIHKEIVVLQTYFRLGR